MKTSLALACLAGLHQANGHYGFPFLVVGGVVSERWEYVRGIKTFYPIEEYSGIDTMCGIAATPSLMRVKTAKITAGDTVGFAIAHQRYSHSARASDGREHEATDSFRPQEKIYHPGPATAWLSKAPDDDIDSYQGDGDWFKFDVIGSKDGVGWEIGDFVDADDSTTSFMNFTIPATTPPGKYLLRAEHLATHYANRLHGAQMYPACAQVEITGSGTGVPGPVTRFPGAFDAMDPAIWLPVALQHPSEPMEALKNWKGAGPPAWRG